MVRALLFGLKAVNYYPARNAWSSMWTAWNPAAIDADFARIASLNGNAVRIIVQAWTLGYPVPKQTMLARLAKTIDLAGKHGLRVQLTLFDWWSSYQDIAGSERWLRAILPAYRTDPRIAFVELQNEIDARNPVAMNWARAMIPYVRRLAPAVPVAVSASDADGLGHLQALVTALGAMPPDIYSFHLYNGGTAAATYSILQEAMQVVSPVPLYIGETGFSSSTSNAMISGLIQAPAALEAYQDQYYRTVDYATRALGLPAAAPWILNDFDPEAVPPGPVRDNPVEHDFGLFRADGSAKPAALTTASFFGSGAVDLGFNGGFEQYFSIGAVRLPMQWLLFHPAQAQFSIDTSVAHSGFASARISRSGGDPSGVPAYYLSPIDAHVLPGQIYSARCWARGENLTGKTTVAIAWFSAANQYLGTIESAPLPAGTTAWAQLSVSGAAPAGAAYVQIHLKSAFNNGTAWFDDVSAG